MELLCDYMEPDYGIPMLNDTNYGHLGNMKDLYEFPYRELGGKRLAFVLNTYYQKESRDNLEAFLYGADTIETEISIRPRISQVILSFEGRKDVTCCSNMTAMVESMTTMIV